MPNNISNGFLDQQRFYRVQDTAPMVHACEALFITAQADFTPASGSMLDKMIQAVKLEPGSSAQVLVLAPGEVLHWLHLQQQTGASATILFGLEPRQLQLQVDFPLYQVMPLYGHQFLFASSLEAIQQDKQLKAQLWGALQLLFGLITPA